MVSSSLYIGGIENPQVNEVHPSRVGQEIPNISPKTDLIIAGNAPGTLFQGPPCH